MLIVANFCCCMAHNSHTSRTEDKPSKAAGLTEAILMTTVVTVKCGHVQYQCSLYVSVLHRGSECTAVSQFSSRE